MDTLKSEIVAIITEINPTVDVPADNTAGSLFDMGMDSLDHASVLLAIEEKYEIKIPDEDTVDLISVDALVAVVAKSQAS